MLHSYMFDNNNQKLEKISEAANSGPIAPKKLISSSFIYELIEYHNWIWLLSVCRESCMMKGSNYASILHV